ncbi:MAG: dUTP diphosphatase [Firmicutes bacterium]|nr:dUTP diphosphatase [[Eubacterium] siraeum]MCM1487864.1 dUTP diphosphatase [Bacillota bacterium]
MKIKTKIIRDGAKLPFRATEGSAGADVFACIEDEITIEPGGTKTVPVGIAVEIPAGFGGFVFPRSSLATKHGIALPNCVGVIDSDYRGELCVPLINHGDEAFTVENGDRIAQLVIMPVENAEYEAVDGLTDTARGEGGFGSTGKR